MKITLWSCIVILPINLTVGAWCDQQGLVCDKRRSSWF